MVLSERREEERVMRGKRGWSSEGKRCAKEEENRGQEQDR